MGGAKRDALTSSDHIPEGASAQIPVIRLGHMVTHGCQPRLGHLAFAGGEGHISSEKVGILCRREGEDGYLQQVAGSDCVAPSQS